jgi:hypothetical protein
MMTEAPVKKRGQRRHNDTPKDKPDRVEPKNLGGRPTKYREEFLEMLLDFFSQPSTREVTVKDAKGNETVQVLPGSFPTLARFATNIGVTTETLHDWATAKNLDGTLRNPPFSYAYKKAKDLQQANLVEGTMKGAYNSTFAIFTAKNVLGWRDKIEQEITGKDGAPIGPSVIAIQFMNPDGTIANIDGHPAN